MSNLLQNYKGLDVPTSTPGEGGRAIKENFEKLADWVNPEVTVQPTGDPEADGTALKEAYEKAKLLLRFEVTGTLSPDVTGTYTGAGFYNDKPYYSLAVSGGDTWYITWDGSANWYLSKQLGATSGDCWLRNDADVEGDYTAQGSATGTATVAVANRAAVRTSPGVHQFGSSTGLELDWSYVDLVGLGPRGAVSMISSAAGGTIAQTANDVKVQNVAFDTWVRTGSTTGTEMIDCVSLDRSAVLSGVQGTMANCTVEATDTNVSAVELARIQYGVGDATDNGNGTTSSIQITGNVADDFPVGAYVKQSDDGTWHRILTSVYDGSTNTDITVTPAATTSFAGKTDLRATHAPKVTGCTLVANGTGNSIATDNETPAEISLCRVNKDIAADVYNVIDAGWNVLESTVSA